MSMVIALSSMSDDSIDTVLANPALVEQVFMAGYEEMLAGYVGDTPDHGLLDKLLGGASKSLSATGAKLDLADGEISSMNLDKSWHGLHFLLTGSAWDGERPLNFLLAGGTEVGDVDLGYGPARVFRSEEVGEINDALGGVSKADLEKRYDANTMIEMDIYPSIWTHDYEDDDPLGYLLEYFAELKKFTAEAASNRFGMVVSLQ